jgi:hypothetical protein
MRLTAHSVSVGRYRRPLLTMIYSPIMQMTSYRKQYHEIITDIVKLIIVERNGFRPTGAEKKDRKMMRARMTEKERKMKERK